MLSLEIAEENMKKILLSIVLVIALKSSAYGAVAVNLYDDTAKYEKTDPKTIKVFRQQPEGRSFIKIGEIVINETGNWNVQENRLKKKASEIGADAVYVVDSQDAGGGYMKTGNMLLPLRGVVITAIAIKYKGTAEPSKEPSEKPADSNKKDWGNKNGNFVDIMLTGGEQGKKIFSLYIWGVIDTLCDVKDKQIAEIYSHKNTLEITDEVIAYYKNNPSKKDRLIVDVVATGCK